MRNKNKVLRRSKAKLCTTCDKNGKKTQQLAFLRRNPQTKKKELDIQNNCWRRKKNLKFFSDLFAEKF